MSRYLNRMPGDVRRCELFSGAQGDERSRLTWKGLFRDVDNTVNFYSTQDEVVANGDGSWKWPLTRKFAWYNQEWARGAYLPIPAHLRRSGGDLLQLKAEMRRPARHE